MKGYTISEDYEMLYELANNEYRIPEWVLYSDAYEPPIFDIVEVKKSSMATHIGIGTRGRGYETFDDSKEAFISNCKILQLKFILPNI